MEVTDKHVGPMTNQEVLSILVDQMEWHTKSGVHCGKGDKIQPSRNRKYNSYWVNEQARKYLKDTAATNQRENVKALMQGLSRIDSENRLTRLQKLSIVNLRPTNAVILEAIVPQLNTFDKDKINAMLDIIKEALPSSDEESEEEDGSDQPMTNGNNDDH